MPFSCASSSGISTNGLGLELDEPVDVLGDVVLVLGQPVARCATYGNSSTRAEPVRAPGHLVVEERDRRRRLTSGCSGLAIGDSIGS